MGGDFDMTRCHDFSLLQQHRDAFAQIQFGNHASGIDLVEGDMNKKWKKNPGDGDF